MIKYCKGIIEISILATIYKKHDSNCFLSLKSNNSISIDICNA